MDRLLIALTVMSLFPTCVWGQASSDAPPVDHAWIDSSQSDWVSLTEADFTQVNCDPETWVWDGDQVHCTGQPVGVLRTREMVTNFEITFSWRHLQSGGNSGMFAWVPEAAITDLPRNRLPLGGIEIQVLDHGYTEKYRQSTGKDPDWFTTNGDVFPVGTSKMKPFPPLSPNGQRSFPRQNLSRGINEWNHYYVRGINGEIRLWVNGQEVSGGNQCTPASGYLCLESEGAPIDFRELRLRRLP